MVLVRHHPTDWTEAGRLQGRRDEPILRPAVANPIVADRLEPLRGQEAWCSTRIRTRETAALYGWPTAVGTPLLDEIDFGSFEGRTRAELVIATSGDWLTDPFATMLRPALLELEERVDLFLVQARARDLPAVVFGHGAWIRLLVAKVRDGNARSMNRLELAPGGFLDLLL